MSSRLLGLCVCMCVWLAGFLITGLKSIWFLLNPATQSHGGNSTLLSHAGVLHVCVHLCVFVCVTCRIHDGACMSVGSADMD